MSLMNEKELHDYKWRIQRCSNEETLTTMFNQLSTEANARSLPIKMRGLAAEKAAIIAETLQSRKDTGGIMG